MASSPKRVLVINIFGIGDVLFTTPLLAALKEQVPDIYIGYVCNKRALGVLANNPRIDKIFLYEKDELRALFRKSKREWGRTVLAELTAVKKEKFDAVIDLSLNWRFSFWAWVLGIRERVGYNYKNRSPYLNVKFPLNGFEDKHVVEYYGELIRHWGLRKPDGPTEVTIDATDHEWAMDVLEKAGCGTGEMVVGLIPGGGASWGPDARFRRWPPERHARLADKIIENHGAKVILMGDPREVELVRTVKENMTHCAVDLAGKTTLGQYLALLALCDLVVLNDGGPLHMAVAAGAQTVSLIGPVDQKVYGPYPSARHRVVTTDVECRPCYRKFRRAECKHISCLNDLSLEDVLYQVDQALGNRV